MKLRISDESEWYVARTNIKCEERALASLIRKGFDVYLPRMRKDIIHHRTKATITREFVLFNRYLFVGVEGKPFQFGFARGCDGVENLLGVDGKPFRIAPETIRMFRDAEVNQEFDDTKSAKIHRGEILANEKAQHSRTFAKGKWITVKEGHPFGGFYGQVTKAIGKSKVLAMLEIFGGLVPVEFSSADLTPLDDDRRAA